MPPISHLLALILCAITVTTGASSPGSPASQGTPYSSPNTLDLNGGETDFSTIISTVGVVQQKAGAPIDSPPNQPVSETKVTAEDGQLTNTPVSSVSSSATKRCSLESRQSPSHLAEYEQVFAGTGAAGVGNPLDASIEGTAYLTYTVVSNATYNIDDCLSFCSGVAGCVFANLYYEFNNHLLDFVFNEHSNLKCALYGDIHSAAEKTNAGGQQSYQAPAPLTYIQDSSGWSAKSIADPSDPSGYELVFGPTNGANNAPGYMGFSFLDRYDVNACAHLCNTRGADSKGGACQYFNIWRALVNGVPTTYTCSFYYIPADASTAVNYGQGNLQVTYSRGYKRTSLLVDGGFEGFTCGNGQDACYVTDYSAWTATSSEGGSEDASFFDYQPYAHSGHGVALFGSADSVDAYPGTITPTQALSTVVGHAYTISFFASSAFHGPEDEQNANLQVSWNGNAVGSITTGFSNWTYYQFSVTGAQAGGDTLSFKGGAAPAYTFVDDVHVFES